MTLNPVLFMQVTMAHALMKRRHLSPDEFLEMDERLGILRFIDTGYEYFHLSGDEGVLQELDEFIDTAK